MEILNYVRLSPPHVFDGLLTRRVQFAERTPNSFIEERGATIVWRFWTGTSDQASDRQWALRQAAEAQNHIFDR